MITESCRSYGDEGGGRSVASGCGEEMALNIALRRSRASELTPFAERSSVVPTRSCSASTSFRHLASTTGGISSARSSPYHW